jgi:biopolymer transport protein ExbB/TolQ
MLGLLGTFVGMVDTFQGAVFALEGSTELQAIREGLAAPINGLSLAFGTSFAGVAASAMLGLSST